MNNNTQFVNRNKMLVLQNLAKQRQEVKLQKQVNVLLIFFLHNKKSK